MGPGRNRALSAIRSSKRSGCASFSKRCMPPPSNWNTATVRAARNSLKTSASSSARVAMSNGGSPWFLRRALMLFTAQSMMVSVRRPRKSNFTSPTASTSSLSNCVTGWLPSASQYKGMKSVSSAGAITTPPACLPALRTRPSSDFARSISWRTSDLMAALGFTIQGHEIGELRRRNHHAAGMFAGIAHQAFQRFRQINQLAHLVVFLIALAQFRLLDERLVERHFQLEGNELGDLVHVAVVVPQHAADVAHHRARRHAAEGDDLRHMTVAVAPGHVVNHAIAALHAEVHVEVRHRDALGIEKTFKQ